MGKIKKGRKAAKDEESGSDAEANSQQQNSKTSNNVKKSKTVGSKSRDETTESMQSKSTDTKKSEKVKEVTDSDASEEELVPVKRVQKSFALLQVEDSESEPEITRDSDSDSNKKPTKVSDDSRTKDHGNKKGKKSRKRKDDSDEDIDKVLAELEMEYSGARKEDAGKTEDSTEAETTVEVKGKKKKEPKSQPSVEEDDEKQSMQEENEAHTVKTAAQKKKEKKEREKQKKLAAKGKGDKKQDSLDTENTENKMVDFHKDNKREDGITTEIGSLDVKERSSESKEMKEHPESEEMKEESPEVQVGEETDKDSKKKKKKGAKDKEDKDAKKGPGKKTIAAMQEALKKLREQEEQAKRDEEERVRREEEAEQARLEALRLEQERKERKKQKEKERKERLKAEGKLLTAKQKADRARAQALIDSLKAQGVELPDVGERKPRPGTRVRPGKQQKQEQQQKEGAPLELAQSDEKSDILSYPVEVEIIEKAEEKKEEPEEDVKDAWDASSEDEESEELSESKTDDSKDVVQGNKAQNRNVQDQGKETKESSSEEESSDSGSEDSDSDESDEDDENNSKSIAEKAKLKVLERIRLRKEEAEKNRNPEVLRAAIVCVLGHVDTGKTKILDKLRRTNVQDGEAGGITQQIGATNVPIDAIKEQIKLVQGVNEMEMKIPGLLIIDTPGHESFSNLRNRGSSLCDIAILVVDIMHGLEPQTLESIELLKSRRTPFVVALNKIDRIYNWQSGGRKDIRDILKVQAANAQQEFQERVRKTILEFAEQGLNAALFYKNPDQRTYVSLVPTSAITGEGMGNLLALLVSHCQSRLAKRLAYSEELQATVLEVKQVGGLGTTIDVILVNGMLREGQTMLCAGTDGVIITQIRSLLMPQPLRELRVKNAYVEYREIRAAQGVKIAAKELEKAIAGLQLYVAQRPDEVEVLREECAREYKSALGSIKLAERGVYVQASTLGSLEALLEFLRTSKIPYSGIRIGPVVKKDVMKASIMLEHDVLYATILAFDVKIERDAQELADSLGVKIFQADIIYHLFDHFTRYKEELKAKKREEFKHIAVFPCKLRVLPQFVFNSRDPIVCGVMVEAGVVKEGTPICVPSKEFLDLGFVSSVEVNHKSVETARKGMEVCIKIEPIPGEAPKMFGRHFDETDMLVSKISRQSIDACKDYFRDDLLKTDWQLMVELKKQFQIL